MEIGKKNNAFYYSSFSTHLFWYFSQCMYIWILYNANGTLKAVKRNFTAHAKRKRKFTRAYTRFYIEACPYMYVCVQVAFRIQFSTGMRGAMGGTETTTCQLTFAISGLFPGQIPGLNCSPPLAFRYGLESIQLLFNLLDLNTPCKMHKSLNNILKYVWRYLRIWLYTQIIYLNIEEKITYFKCYVHCVTIIYLTESILKFSCLTQTLISLLLINKMPCLDFQGNSMNLSRTRQVSHFPLRTSHLLAINS